MKLCDLHTHVLPGVDDGAQSMEYALQMLCNAAASDVQLLAVTPHCNRSCEMQNYLEDGLADRFLQLQKADYAATGKIGDAPDYAAVEALLSQLLLEKPPMTAKDLAISGHDVMALGYSGPAVGQAMNWLLDQVLEEKIPNQRQALLDALYRR